MVRLPGRRAVSPLVGTLLMVALVILLASMLSVTVLGVDLPSLATYERGIGERSDSTGAPYDYGDNITAVDNGAGTTTKHVVTLNVTGNAVGNSLNQLTVTYDGGETVVSDSSKEPVEDLRVTGIDEDGDGRIDDDAMGDVEDGDVTVADDGSELVVEWTGNHDLDAGDKLIVVYGAVTNPDSTGDHDGAIDLNGDRVYDGAITTT